MTWKVTTTFGVLLLVISSSKSQQDLPDKPLETIYMCAGGNRDITCPYGFVVNVQTGIMYGVVNGTCTMDTVKEAEKLCTANGGINAIFQTITCNNKPSCKVYDATGVGLGCGTTNFILVPYICKFVGYKGMSSLLPTPPPTTTETITTTKAQQPVTVSSTSVTAKSNVSSTPVMVNSTNSSTSVTADQTSVITTKATPPSTSTNVPLSTDSAAQSSKDDLNDEEKIRLIIGVSVSAVVILLIIIVLVECKRQRRKRNYKQNSAVEINEEPPTEDPKVLNGSPMAEHSIDVDDEIAIINKEPERRFRKKNETDKVYDNPAAVDPVPPHLISPVARHASVPDEPQLSGSVHSGRDSGVSALYSEEGVVEESDGEPQEYKSTEPEEQSKPVRRVTFNEQGINTDMTAIDKGDNTPRSSSISSSNSKSDDRPALDRTISGPGSEREVLY